MFVFREPTLYSTLAPKGKSTNAGNLDMPTRSCKVLPVSEKVKDVELIGREKNRKLRLLRSMVRVNPLFLKL